MIHRRQFLAAAAVLGLSLELSSEARADAVDDTLPPEIDRLMRQKTMAGKLGAAAGAIFSRPTAAKDLWDLRGMALKSSDRLAKFLAGMIEQLPAQEAVADNPSPPAE